MTKQEAIEMICIIETLNDDKIPLSREVTCEAFDIAIECIQECIDREESPCSNCQEWDCRGCLYNGRID